MLTSTEQSLFRRAQVRQLLEYERSADPTQYAADLDWLLTSDDVRLHLKGLVIDLLGVVSHPGSREADMLVPLLLDNTSLLQPRAWLAVRGNPAWFPVMHDAGLWQAAITEESRQLTDRALWALGPALAEFPTSRQLVRDLPDNPARIPRWRNVLTYSALLSRRVPLDLMAESIDQGMWDGEDASRDFWSIVHRVAESEAPTAVEIVRRLLARHIQSALTEGGGSLSGMPVPSAAA